VTVPRRVLERALWKMEIEYANVAERYGRPAPPEGECWAEIEALASYARK
jgi:hypothetical protein